MKKRNGVIVAKWDLLPIKSSPKEASEASLSCTNL